VTTTDTATADTVRVDVRIYDDSGALTIRQTIHATPTATPGLVIHPLLLGPVTVDDNWCSVTHAPSGKRLPATFRTAEAAAAFAKAVGPLTNWEAQQPRTSQRLKEEATRLRREHGGIPDWQYTDECHKAAAA